MTLSVHLGGLESGSYDEHAPASTIFSLPVELLCMRRRYEAKLSAVRITVYGKKARCHQAKYNSSAPHGQADASWLRSGSQLVESALPQRQSQLRLIPARLTLADMCAQLDLEPRRTRPKRNDV